MSELKHLHVDAVIAVEILLTPEQLTKLRGARKNWRTAGVIHRRKS